MSGVKIIKKNLANLRQSVSHAKNIANINWLLEVITELKKRK